MAESRMKFQVSTLRDQLLKRKEEVKKNYEATVAEFERGQLANRTAIILALHTAADQLEEGGVMPTIGNGGNAGSPHLDIGVDEPTRQYLQGMRQPVMLDTGRIDRALQTLAAVAGNEIQLTRVEAEYYYSI